MNTTYKHYHTFIGLQPTEEEITLLLNRAATGYPLRGYRSAKKLASRPVITLKDIFNVHTAALQAGTHTPQTLALATALSVRKVRACIKYLLRYNFVEGVDILTDPQGIPENRELL